MAVFRVSRLSRHVLGKSTTTWEEKIVRTFRTVVEEPKPTRRLLKTCLISAGVGGGIGTGYAFWKVERDRKRLEREGQEITAKILKFKPDVPVSRTVKSPVDYTGLKLTLYQYQSCPFCCKIRTFLDYYGISYEVVEVDSVLRNKLKWSNYRKVPILLAKVDGGYQQLNDSSMIMSLLASYLNDKSNKITELASYYPSIAVNTEAGYKEEIVNKYFLMYQGSTPKGRTLDDIVEERKWRMWADEVLVHTLSPNVYRTIDESYQTFNWFSEVGKWDEYFSSWQRALMINVGSLFMWGLGKRLKKKHHLKTDVRESLYDDINTWLNAIQARGGQFMGGSNPDLSDLTVFGTLRSIEGCEAFKDALQHTKLSTWYSAMAEQVKNHSGSASLHQ